MSYDGCCQNNVRNRKHFAQCENRPEV